MTPLEIAQHLSRLFEYYDEMIIEYYFGILFKSHMVTLLFTTGQLNLNYVWWGSIKRRGRKSNLYPTMCQNAFLWKIPKPLGLLL